MEQEKLELEVTKVEEPTKVENKPTDEEIKQFEQDAVDAVEEFSNKKWQIGDDTNGEKYLNFIQEFLEKYSWWTKTLWMGFCKLEEELNTIFSDIKEKKILNLNLLLSYQALEFTHYILSNPTGVGLQSAKDIQKRSEDFNELFLIVDKSINEARELLKIVQHKQDVFSAACQGFYLEKLTDNLEKPIETEDKTCECGENCECKNKN